MSIKDNPYVVVKVAGALLALPVDAVSGMGEAETTAALDLGALSGMCADAQPRSSCIELKTAAGLIPLGVDGIVDVLAETELLPLPPLTLVRHGRLLRGVLRVDRPDLPKIVVAVDGARLGDLVAEQLMGEAP